MAGAQERGDARALRSFWRPARTTARVPVFALDEREARQPLAMLGGPASEEASAAPRPTPVTPAEAEDATQETFIRAYRKLDKVEQAEKLRSWLYAIAGRVCSERSRSARISPAVTATVAMPSSAAARAIRMAISPRLAISNLSTSPTF